MTILLQERGRSRLVNLRFMGNGNATRFAESTFASGRRGMQPCDDRIRAVRRYISARQPVSGAYTQQAVNWTGFYIGAHLGGAWSDANWTDPVSGVSNNLANAGVLGGGQLGFNYQFDCSVRFRRRFLSHESQHLRYRRRRVCPQYQHVLDLHRDRAIGLRARSGALLCKGRCRFRRRERYRDQSPWCTFGHQHHSSRLDRRWRRGVCDGSQLVG
jgi:hypothetical protein